MSWKAGKMSFTFFTELDIKKMNRFCIPIEKEVEIVYKIYQRLSDSGWQCGKCKSDI